MADSIKINKLEIENVKRIKAVKIEPTKNGLTIVGGNNNQGKTSVLDSIAWALGEYVPEPEQTTGQKHIKNSPPMQERTPTAMETSRKAQE